MTVIAKICWSKSINEARLALRFTTFLTIGMTIPVEAQRLIEEAEPNNAPHEAQVTDGAHQIIGHLQGDDVQDAFIWRLSEADAQHSWNLTLDGMERARTIAWLLRLHYDDTAREQVAQREDLLTLSSGERTRSATAQNLLMAPGEYLVGISSLDAPTSSPILSLDRAPASLNPGSTPPALSGSDLSDRYHVRIKPANALTIDTDSPGDEATPLVLVAGGEIIASRPRDTIIKLTIKGTAQAALYTVSGRVQVGETLTATLRQADGSELSRASAGRQSGYTYVMPSLALSPGDYQLHLAHNTNDGRVLLSAAVAQTGEWLTGQEAEPNNSWPLANHFDLNDGVNAKFDTAKDWDHFSFDVDATRANQPFDLHVTLADAANSTTVCLYTDTNDTLQCRKDTGRVVLPALSLGAGRYGVKTERALTMGDYRLAISPTGKRKRNVEIEPNDIPSFAHVMGKAKVVKGDLSSAEDVDYLTFTVDDPDVLYRVQTEHVGRLTISDAQGNTVTSLNAASGSARIRADGLDLLPGRYLLTLSHGSDKPYRVLVRNLGPIPADFEREPNDDLSGALRLTMNETRRGIQPDGDPADMYVFRLDGRERVGIDIKAPDDSELKARLTHQGSYVANAVIKANETYSYVGDLLPGFYSVRLVSSTPSQSHYTITVRLDKTVSAAFDEREPNNWYNDANAIAPGGRMRGEAAGLGGDDWFRTTRPDQPGYLIRACNPSTTAMAIQGFTDSFWWPLTSTTTDSNPALHLMALQPDTPSIVYYNYRNGGYDCTLYHAPVDTPEPLTTRTSAFHGAVLEGQAVIDRSSQVTGYYDVAFKDRTVLGDVLLVKPAAPARTFLHRCRFTQSGEALASALYAMNKRVASTGLKNGWVVTALPEQQGSLQFRVGQPGYTAIGAYACDVVLSEFDKDALDALPTDPTPVTKRVEAMSDAVTWAYSAVDSKAGQIQFQVDERAQLALVSCVREDGSKGIAPQLSQNDISHKHISYWQMSSGRYTYAFDATVFDPSIDLTVSARPASKTSRPRCAVNFEAPGADENTPVLTHRDSASAPLSTTPEAPVTEPTHIKGAVYWPGQRIQLPIDAPAGSPLRVRCMSERSDADTTIAAKPIRNHHLLRPLEGDAWLFQLDPRDAPHDMVVVTAKSKDWSQPVPFTCDIITDKGFSVWPPTAPAPQWSIDAVTIDTTSIAAYSPLAQTLRARSAIHNKGIVAVTLALEAHASGRAWRVEGVPATVTVAPGETRALTMNVVAAPQASQLVQPRVMVRASDAHHHQVQRSPLIDVAPEHPTHNTELAWRLTPTALQGGLNLLDIRRGGAMKSIDGKAVKPDAHPFFHDGQAPFASSGKIGRDIVFVLAGEEPAPVRGFVFSMRLESRSELWARDVRVQLSVDGEQWTDAGAKRLASVMHRQFIVLDEPIMARYARLINDGSHSHYESRELNEFMVIAQPGHLPAAWSPIDLTASEFDGHLVAARVDGYPTQLTDPARYVYFREQKSIDESIPAKRYWILGFANNRAARISGFEWDAGEREAKDQSPTLEVSVSIDGVRDFKPLVTLSKPVEGTTISRVMLDAPVYARFVRFEIPGTKAVAAPRQVRIFEQAPDDGYLPVAGLWDEDDRRGPYEWFNDTPAAVNPEKVGGSSKDDAIALTLGTDVKSTVRYGDAHADWFKLDALEESRTWIFAIDGDQALRQVGLDVVDNDGNRIDIEILAQAPKADYQNDALTGVVFDSPRPDSRLYRLTQPANTPLYLRINVPGRLAVMRAENVGAVINRRHAIVRSIRDWANRLDGEQDALQLLQPTPFDDDQRFVRGRARILKALNSEKMQGDGVASYAQALDQTARQFAAVDGAKLMVAFATGAIFNDADDYWYSDVIAEHPLTMWNMYLSCNVFGCPSTRPSAHRMRASAALANSRFERVAQTDDIEEALLAAFTHLNAGKPYRLSSARVRAPGEANVSTTDAQTETGSGEMLVSVERGTQSSSNATGPAIALVLDASGSMLKRMPGSDGKRRIAVAHASLTELVSNGLPDQVAITYRAFGLKKGACETRALLPLAPLNREAASKAIQATPAINLAKTAIAASLTAAGQDLSGHAGEKTIVLVTDGEETCEGDVTAAITSLRNNGVDVTLQIVGFAIDDAALKSQFEQWAALGGGQYFDASSGEDLSSALFAATKLGFTVIDAENSTPVAVGRPDEVLVLPVGDYRIVFDDTDIAEQTVRVSAGQRVSVAISAQ